jgi:hypothetical protein
MLTSLATVTPQATRTAVSAIAYNCTAKATVPSGTPCTASGTVICCTVTT